MTSLHKAFRLQRVSSSSWLSQRQKPQNTHGHKPNTHTHTHTHSHTHTLTHSHTHTLTLTFLTVRLKHKQRILQQNNTEPVLCVFLACQQARPVLWVCARLYPSPLLRSLVPPLLSLPDMLWWRDKLKVILREQRLCSGMCGITRSCSVDKKAYQRLQRCHMGPCHHCSQYEPGIDDLIWESLEGDTHSQQLVTTPICFDYSLLLCEQFKKKWGEMRLNLRLNYRTGKPSIQNWNNSKAVSLVQLVYATKAVVMVLKRSEKQRRGKLLNKIGVKNGTQFWKRISLKSLVKNVIPFTLCQVVLFPKNEITHCDITWT